MPELREGLILTLDQVKNSQFTFKGKEIKLEQDKDNPLVYRGQTKLSKDEEKAGNLNTAFVYNAGTASGVLNSYIVIPETDDFKDLTDSEKVTKLHSIEYQFGTEPTDDGKQLDHVLQNSVDTTPAQDKQTQKSQQQQKQKEAAAAAGTTDSENKDFSGSSGSTVKSGDKVQLKK